MKSSEEKFSEEERILSLEKGSSSDDNPTSLTEDTENSEEYSSEEDISTIEERSFSEEKVVPFEDDSIKNEDISKSAEDEHGTMELDKLLSKKTSSACSGESFPQQQKKTLIRKSVAPTIYFFKKEKTIQSTFVH